MNLTNRYKFYIVIISLLVVIEFVSFMEKPNLVPKEIDLPTSSDTDILKQYIQIYDENKSYNSLWNIKEEIVKKEIEDINETTKETKVTLDKKEKKICIEDECFRLLGFKSVDKNSSISLYNPKSKKRICSYAKGDEIMDGIYVEGLSGSKVIYGDYNSSRKWQLKLFDVNKTKYKPKDIEL